MNHWLHLPKDLNILLTFVKSLMLLLGPAACGLTKRLSCGHILLAATHFERRLVKSDGINHGKLVSLSPHLTRVAGKRTFLGAELLRKSRFIPRIVLNRIDVITGMMLAHTGWTTLWWIGRVLLLVALRLGPLVLALLLLPLLGLCQVGRTWVDPVHQFCYH